jgi:plasmid segregation protein ParM
MIDTKKFKTSSEIIPMQMPRVNGNNQHIAKTIIGLDVGYSSVKGISPVRAFIFPSYAKLAPKGLEVVGRVNKYDIQYKDNKTGEIWLVGQAAESLIDQVDLDSTTDASLFNRHRYDSPIFKVLAGCGLALGLWGTGEGNEIFVQTGLPSNYKGQDDEKLLKALMGDYDISIKVGAGDWVNFKFNLNREHIFIMEQPQGTLVAAAYKNGSPTEDGKKMMMSNSLIYDIGFNTEDIFQIRAGYKSKSKTYLDTSMRAVFDAVIEELKNRFPVEYKIFEFQKYLEDGKAPYFDAEAFKTEYIDFADILEEVNQRLCEKSIKRLVQEYDNLSGYKYLIVSGGTGESRFMQISKMLEGFPELHVIPGNVNTPSLPYVFNNVVGYYTYRHNIVQKQLKDGVLS